MEMTGIFKNIRFLCAASVAGPSHVKKGIVNQDSFLCVKKRKYILLVVSDGMGSKPFAELGSKKACEAVAAEIKSFVKNKKNPLSISELFSNIIARWKKLILPHEAKECSATCLFVFATKHKIMAARLGDGMICLLGKAERKSLLLSDKKEGDFSNATQSLSDSAASAEFEYCFLDRSEFKGLVLSTDGISADLENGNELPFAADIFSELRKMFFWKRCGFIKNMMENWSVPHHTDDKTLIVAGL